MDCSQLSVGRSAAWVFLALRKQTTLFEVIVGMDGSRTLLNVRPLRRVQFHLLIVVELWRERIFGLRLGHWGVRADRFSRDPRRALEYFTRASQLFDTSALFWLGHAHRTGLPEAGLPVSGKRALRMLELAAGQGHPGAQHYLAQLLRAGDERAGIAPDGARAAFFQGLAVEAGHPDALYEAGHALATGEGGEGVAVDEAAAL